MKLHVFAYALPAILIAVALPLVVGAVPPNGWYGFRTPRTLSSPEIWYPANRASGWILMLAAAAAIVVNLSLWWLKPHWPESRLLFWMANSMGIAALFSVVASLLYLRRI